MANFHGTMKMISRQGGKSCVAALAYRSATKLEDQRTGEVWDYTKKRFVGHVEILTPEGAPQWLVGLAQKCQVDRQAALQKLSNIFEVAEKRKDSQVYREFEFSLPNELTEEQNIAWAKDFIHHTFVKKGMVAISCFHFDIDSETGMAKPHCHLLLSTRDLTEDGFGLKNRTWNDKSLCEEAREQCAAYQNLALKEYGFEVRVDHRSYVDQGLEIDPQPKRGKSIFAMRERGIETDKQNFFDLVRLKNQFRIIKNPELVFSIVTSKHSTFTRKDIAKVLHRYIDDADQFRILHDRLMGSKELIDLASSARHGDGQEPVYTTREMLRIELNLIRQAENLSVQRTHPVAPSVIEKVITNHNEKLAKYGGLSPDQNRVIRHLFSGEQISCVIGFAGAGKTTSLEAAKEGWEQAGYRVIGLAPTGKAARNIEGCGIRSMTLHKFLYAQKEGREQITSQTVIVVDEAGMVDSRKFSELLSLVDATGAKIVLMGDGNQLQAVEAGPAFRLLTERVKPAVLETIVRHQVEWQRDATRLFGTLEPRKALTLYQENGCFQPIKETRPDFQDKEYLLDSFCLARQMSGRIWKEMVEDYKGKFSGQSFDPETDFGLVADHPDFSVFHEWKSIRQGLVERIIQNYANGNENLKSILVDKEVDIQRFENLVATYQTDGGKNVEVVKQIESILREMSYENIVDTRSDTKQALAEAWAADRKASLDQSHLMLAFTNKDALGLNESARVLMREQEVITGRNYQFVTQHIEVDDFGDEVKTYQNREFAKGDRLLFTRNNNSLKVKNGTLGTILSLDQNKITVALDEKGGKGEEKTMSFAPKLYPFIDHGWATTIYKAQGVTVDHIKLLASFEQYRNLAYVGMSRHRHSLKVFYSDLDFWRPEKVIDRLSRIQEKLSGFDYLNTSKIEEQMKEDAQVLWHEKKIQQSKDFWSAIKVTTRDILGQSRSHSLESAEGFLSFEDSEEMRSKDFFTTPSSVVIKTGHYESHPGSTPVPKQLAKLDNYAPQEGLAVNKEHEFDLKRQAFEKDRLPFHQNWCTKMGFMKEHKRLPRNAEELSTAYWQGERLTAIEGRLYQQALEQGKKVKQDDFIQQAREELLKHQKAPDYIMAFPKSPELTQHQQNQFEQHVLIHRDKTGTLPIPTDLKAICQAIMVHHQLNEQGFGHADKKVTDERFMVYQGLIEQQTILKNAKDRPDSSFTYQTNQQDFKDACAEKLGRLNKDVQAQIKLSQEMNRSHQRGMDFGP